MKIIMLGAPGAGKGTQAKMIAAKDGELKMIHRDLVNLCQVPAGNMACSVSPSPEATSNGLMFQGKGEAYEHSDK